LDGRAGERGRIVVKVSILTTIDDFVTNIDLNDLY
jgi:hypothetical protein